MLGKKLGIKRVLLVFSLVGILGVCEGLEEKYVSSSDTSYVRLAVVEQVTLSASVEEEEEGKEGEDIQENLQENVQENLQENLTPEEVETQKKEEETAKRRKNNLYFAAFVTLGAIGNSVSFYKLAKRMK